MAASRSNTAKIAYTGNGGTIVFANVNIYTLELTDEKVLSLDIMFVLILL